MLDSSEATRFYVGLCDRPEIAPRDGITRTITVNALPIAMELFKAMTTQVFVLKHSSFKWAFQPAKASMLRVVSIWQKYGCFVLILLLWERTRLRQLGILPRYSSKILTALLSAFLAYTKKGN